VVLLQVESFSVNLIKYISMTAASKSKLRLCALVILASFTSCDQNKKSNAASDNPDSMPVIKMSTDSNSAMPVHTPKDSTERIPNPYDSSKK
jgi:hypothetical protein